MQVRTIAVLTLLACLLSSAIVPAATWRVPQDAVTIRAALERAAAGDAIVVACGTYREHNLLLKSGVVLRSATGQPDCVTIDAQGAGRVLHGENLSATTVVEGFTITGGRAEGPTAFEASGGGIFLADAHLTVRNCVIAGNTAQKYGGGVRVNGGSPVFVGCAFRGNGVATGGGGGASCRYGATPAFVDCSFTGNLAAWGGALECRVEAQATLTGCLLQGNVAIAPRGFGGAVFCDFSSSPSLEQCTIILNEALTGGGLALFSGASPRLARCTIAANRAQEGGGGLMCLGAAPDIQNSIIAFNQLEALAAYGQEVPALQCSNLFGNDGGDWVGAIAGLGGRGGNLSVDPLFWGEVFDGPEDFNLHPESPCTPQNSACGGMGSRGVSTDGVTDAWPAPEVRTQGSRVTLRWRFTGDGPAPEFRLLAVSDGVEWVVPVVAEGGGWFSAADDAAPGGVVVYTLQYRYGDGDWRLAWTQPVQAGASPPLLRIAGAHPNPFNPRTTITLELGSAQRVRLAVHDLRGRPLATLFAGSLPSGAHAFTWDGTDDAGRLLSSGTYLAVLEGGVNRDAHKLTMLR